MDSMNYDREVLKFSASATRLAKKETILVFSRWHEVYPYPNHSGFTGRVLKGQRALQEFGTRHPIEYYAIFEWKHHRTPTVFRCTGLQSSTLPLDGRDIAIVDFQGGWSMVFYHEDDCFTDGPYFYAGAETAGAGIAI